MNLEENINNHLFFQLPNDTNNGYIFKRSKSMCKIQNQGNWQTSSNKTSALHTSKQYLQKPVNESKNLSTNTLHKTWSSTYLIDNTSEETKYSNMDSNNEEYSE